MTEPPNERVIEFLLRDSAKRHQYQHEFSLAGFKTLILLNGGAIISLLTYLGHSTGQQIRHQLSAAFTWYVIGLVSVVLAYLVAYLSQGAFLRATSLEAFKRLSLGAADALPGKHIKKGNLAIVSGIILFMISLIAFVAGSWCAKSALS